VKASRLLCSVTYSLSHVYTGCIMYAHPYIRHHTCIHMPNTNTGNTPQMHSQTDTKHKALHFTDHSPPTHLITHTRMTTTAMHLYSIWSHCTLSLYCGTTRQTTGTTRHPITNTMLKRLLTHTHTDYILNACTCRHAHTLVGWRYLTHSDTRACTFVQHACRTYSPA